jgi:hypothetical protein
VKHTVESSFYEVTEYRNTNQINRLKKLHTLWRIEGDVCDGKSFMRDAGVRLEDDG